MSDPAEPAPAPVPDPPGSRPARGAALLLTLWVLLWNGDALWGASTWFFHDLKHHHWPWRVWAAETWSSGEVPLWAPIAHGYPLLADGQAGVLYPPNMVLFRLFSPLIAFNLSIIGHHLLAALGALWLARTLGRSVPASTVAGVAFGFSGFLISHLVYLPMFEVIAWVPWMVGLAVRGVRDGGPWWALAGLAIAMAWLAGHPQMALYATYAAVWVAGVEAASHRARWRSIAIGALGMAVTAVLIALPQLWASAELVRFGSRDGGVDEGFAAMGSLPPEELVHAVLPRWLGFETPADVPISYHHRAGMYAGRGVSYWEDCFFLGVPTVLMALAAGRARRGRVWWVLGAVGVLLMLGAATPLFPVLRLLPGMGWFRFPVRAAIWVTLAASMLAAIGVDRLGGWLIGAPGRVGRIAAIAFVGVLVAWGGAAIGSVVLEGREAEVQSALAARLVREGPDARGPEEAAERAAEVIRELQASLSPLGDRVLWPVGMGLFTAGLWWAASRGKVAGGLPVRLLPMAIWLDLLVFGVGFNPRTPASEVLERPESATWLLGRPGPHRTTVLDRRVPKERDQELLSANLGLVWGAEDVIVPSPLRTLRNEEWVDRAGLGLDLVDGDEQIRRFTENRALADLSGVRWLLTTHDLDLPDLAAVHATIFDGEAVHLYENARAMPRAFVVGCTRALEPGESALEAVLALDDPRGTAIVEGPGLDSCAPEPVGEVTVERTLQAALTMEVTLEEPGFLVVTESAYPGMMFRVDGEPVAPVRTDDLFVGVALEAGRHEVLLAYLPMHLYAAMAIAALTAGLTSAWAVRRLSPSRAESEASPSTP